MRDKFIITKAMVSKRVSIAINARAFEVKLGTRERHSKRIHNEYST